jgi:hypothetical protein
MNGTTAVARKPFHEAIVEMLKWAMAHDLETLGKLLIMTKIPKGHDEILAAWNAKCQELRLQPESFDYIVAEDILQQKKDLEAEGGANAKQAENNLDRYRFTDEKRA